MTCNVSATGRPMPRPRSPGPRGNLPCSHGSLARARGKIPRARGVLGSERRAPWGRALGTLAEVAALHSLGNLGQLGPLGSQTFWVTRQPPIRLWPERVPGESAPGRQASKLWHHSVTGTLSRQLNRAQRPTLALPFSQQYQPPESRAFRYTRTKPCPER